MAYIDIKNECKRYQMGDTTIVANDNITFQVEKGEFVVILGPSGAGKSTFLNILGGMDSADEGSILIDGKDIAKYNAKELTTYRRLDVGFIFQFYNLVPNLTAKENVELASQIVPNAMDIDETLELVGLGHRKDNFPSQLSGGEQQRVAIARALISDPKIIFADEPTGNLDEHTAHEIEQLLFDLNRELGTTLVLVTHDPQLAAQCQRHYELKDGVLIEHSQFTQTGEVV